MSDCLRLWVWGIVSAALLFPVGNGWAETRDEMAQLKGKISELEAQSRWPEAMPLAEQLVGLCHQQHGETNAETSEALHAWAYVVQENGDLQKAEKLWLRALAIDQTLFGANTVQTTRRLHLLANCYRDQGDFAKAAPLLERALTIRENHFGPDHPETANIMTSIARLYSAGGDFARAETNLTRALRIYENAGLDYRSPNAGTLSSLGWLYFSMGDYERAEATLKASLTLRKQLYKTDHAYLASGLRELAVLHFHQGQFKEAESLFQQALDMRQRLLGTNHVSLGEALSDLGTAYLAQRDLTTAEPLLTRARAILERNLGSNHTKVAEVLRELSLLEEKRGNYEVARDLCAQAYQIRERHLGPLHHLTLSSLRKLAWLEAALGHPDRALATADQLEKGQERTSEGLLSFTSERQRLGSQIDSILSRANCDLWADLGATQPLACALLRTKGIVLDSVMEDRRLAMASRDAEARELVSRVSQARSHLSQLLFAAVQGTGGTNACTELQIAFAQTESLEGLLARRVAGLGQTRPALSIRVDQVQSALPQGTVLLDMVRYCHYLGHAQWADYYGTVLLSCHDARWVALGRADLIDKAVKLHQHAIRNAGAPEQVVSSLHALYERLWKPLVKDLPAETVQVIISPESELNFISFATLLSPADRFLGEDHLFSYVSSARDLLVQNTAGSTNSTLLVWANPEFGADPNSTRAQAGQGRARCELFFGPLPGAEQEGRSLYDHAQELGFQRAVLYSGTNATEAELRHVHSPRALHFATHAFVLPEIELPGFSEESYAETGKLNIPLRKLSPMLRCGLALAGVQNTLQNWALGNTVLADSDGVVTADEIGRLDLHGTRLVVLSGCDTGGGEARAGEGVLGLRRGFIQAGAQNLLLTLWPVEDKQTARWMPEFYAEIKRLGTIWKALAVVQRNWLKKLRDEKGAAEACRIAGPFILSFQGKVSDTH